MKTIKNVNVSKAVIVLLMFFSASAFAQKKDNIKTVVIKTMIYCDHCKQCETCGDKFNKDLYNEDGIKRVDIDSKAMTITVIYDSKKTDIDKIRLFISKLGYDADDIKADPAGVAKLDGCCKK
ncbi:MAG TPA: heavy-metal-associated domain-containing protein [Bacteroidia bacterium]|nr:heavy-metal-associated domain-containing protein [Bacteroidia bacterium]